MIQIKNISGTTILEAPITDSCERVRELMKDDYIKFSFSHHTLIPLKEGSYVEYNGVKYSLLEPFEPSYKTENNLLYEPVFHSPVSGWRKIPLFYTEQNLDEYDWKGTMTIAQFLTVVVNCLKKQGQTYTVSIQGSFEGAKLIEFSGVSVLDGLNAIVKEWETEWWVEGSTIVVGKCSYGVSVPLSVGENVSVSSVSKTDKEFYTRFYVLGSTKNISQTYSNGMQIVNKRLALPSKYTNGCIDVRPNLQPGEIFATTLIFDDIYPSFELTITETRKVQQFSKDDNGNKIEIGKDSQGNPIYKTYAIWYFKCGYTLDNSLIIGPELKMFFNSGQLSGREFKLSHKDGEYEIIFEDSDGFIIPGETALIPEVGNKFVFLNINMPPNYEGALQEAELRLEAEALKEIEKRNEDDSTYTLESCPAEFHKGNISLSVGQNVSLAYMGRTVKTRVLSVRTNLAFPSIQSFTIGENKQVGKLEELKDNVDVSFENLEDLKQEVKDARKFASTLVNGIKVGSTNLLINSGFQGDFKTEDLKPTSTLSSKTPLYSNQLKNWIHSKVDIVAEAKAKSGFCANMQGGELIQRVDFIEDETYTVSFYGKGSTCKLSGETISLGQEYKRIVHTYKPSGNKFQIEGICVIYDLKLERGTIATDWDRNPNDTPEFVEQFLALNYITSAITDGNTKVLGGLILSSMIQLGMWKGEDIDKITCGLSGIVNDGDDPAFWAGGDLAAAIRAILDPSDPLGAAAVITHNGRAVLNDAIIRGIIYAVGGKFTGDIESNIDGKRIVISAETRDIKLLDERGFTVARLSFYTDDYGTFPLLRMRNLDAEGNWYNDCMIAPNYMLFSSKKEDGTTGKFYVQQGMKKGTWTVEGDFPKFSEALSGQMYIDDTGAEGFYQVRIKK